MGSIYIVFCFQVNEVLTGRLQSHIRQMVLLVISPKHEKQLHGEPCISVYCLCAQFLLICLTM